MTAWDELFADVEQVDGIEAKASARGAAGRAKRGFGKLGHLGRLGAQGAWKEELHPRDSRGRFIETGSTVKLRGGAAATVIGRAAGDLITVRRSDNGKVYNVDRGQLTVTARPDGSAPTDKAGAHIAEMHHDPTTEMLGHTQEELDRAAGLPPMAHAPHAPDAATPAPATPPAEPRFVGTTPAPDANPYGADRYLNSLDRSADAWIRTDEGPEPVGYVRTNVNDPSTTVRYANARDWADDVDAMAMGPARRPVPPTAQAAPAAGTGPRANPTPDADGVIRLRQGESTTLSTGPRTTDVGAGAPPVNLPGGTRQRNVPRNHDESDPQQDPATTPPSPRVQAARDELLRLQAEGQARHQGAPAPARPDTPHTPDTPLTPQAPLTPRVPLTPRPPLTPQAPLTPRQQPDRALRHVEPELTRVLKGAAGDYKYRLGSANLNEDERRIGYRLKVKKGKARGAAQSMLDGMRARGYVDVANDGQGGVMLMDPDTGQVYRFRFSTGKGANRRDIHIASPAGRARPARPPRPTTPRRDVWAPGDEEEDLDLDVEVLDRGDGQQALTPVGGRRGAATPPAAGAPQGDAFDGLHDPHGLQDHSTLPNPDGTPATPEAPEVPHGSEPQKETLRQIAERLRAERAAQGTPDTPQTPDTPEAPAGNTSLDDLEARAQAEGGTVLFHGGLPAGTTLDSIDLNRNGEQQNKRGRTFGGFYLTDESSRAWSEDYAKKRNGVMHGFLISPEARIDDRGDQVIDRLSAEDRAKAAEHFDVIKGKDSLGRAQYVLLNKDVVQGVGETNLNDPADSPHTPDTPAAPEHRDWGSMSDDELSSALSDAVNGGHDTDAEAIGAEMDRRDNADRENFAEPDAPAGDRPLSALSDDELATRAEHAAADGDHDTVDAIAAERDRRGRLNTPAHAGRGRGGQLHGADGSRQLGMQAHDDPWTGEGGLPYDPNEDPHQDDLFDAVRAQERENTPNTPDAPQTPAPQRGKETAAQRRARESEENRQQSLAASEAAIGAANTDGFESTDGRNFRPPGQQTPWVRAIPAHGGSVQWYVHGADGSPESFRDGDEAFARARAMLANPTPEHPDTPDTPGTPGAGHPNPPSAGELAALTRNAPRDAHLDQMDEPQLLALLTDLGQEMGRHNRRRMGDRGFFTRADRLETAARNRLAALREAANPTERAAFTLRNVLHEATGEGHTVDTGEMARHFGVPQPRMLAALRQLERDGYLVRNSGNDEGDTVSGGRRNLNSLGWESAAGMDDVAGQRALLDRFDREHGTSADNPGELLNAAPRAPRGSRAQIQALREAAGVPDTAEVPHGSDAQIEALRQAATPEGVAHAGTLDTPQTGGTGERQPVRADRGAVLDDVPAQQGGEAARPAEVLRPAGAGRGRPGAVDDGRPAAAAGERDGLPGEGRGAGDRPAQRGGDRAAGAGVPAAGDGARGPGAPDRAGAGSGDRRVAARIEEQAQADAPSFRPSGQQDLQPTGKKAKARANIEAFRTLLTLEREGRPATPDEQRVLARWSGWGAVPEVFDKVKYPAFAKEHDELRSLMSDAEWTAAEKNTLNAHYTDGDLVSAAWQAVEDLGFTGGRVLEPGSGAGTFIGMAPRDAEMVGVELDPTTARISQALYPHATIRNESFADTKLPEGSFDAAVGNVPFGNFALHDREGNPNGHSIHNHFILKTLQAVRPGGIAALITSHYTMDGEGQKNTQARSEMGELADLVAAIRLPSGAHKRAADTDVVTDLLIFRRRAEGQPPAGADFEHAARQALPGGGEAAVNDYFLQHPENVLGTMTTGRGQFSDSDLVVQGDKNAAPALRAALGRATQSAKVNGLAGTERTSADVNVMAPLLAAGSSQQEGHIGLGDKEFTRTITHTQAGKPLAKPRVETTRFTTIENGAVVPYYVPGTQAKELESLLGLRDATRALLAEETRSNEDNDTTRGLRKVLNDRYDAYVRDFGGPINRVKWAKTADVDEESGQPIMAPRQLPHGGFRDDPGSAIVYALEDFDQESGTARKTNIFTERVVAQRTLATKADNPADAVSLSLEAHGQVDLGYIAGLLGTDEAGARRQLGTEVFDDPENPGQLVARAEYLSGDTRAKRKAAQEALDTAQDPAERERLQTNVDELNAVVPTDLAPEEIDGRLGAAWIGEGDVQQFVSELLNDRFAKVHHGGGTVWKVEGAKHSYLATDEWGTRRRPAGDLIERLLTGKTVEVMDTFDNGDGSKTRVLNREETDAAQEKANAIQERFGEWLWEDPARAERLSQQYNDTYNSLVAREYPSTPLALPGMRSGFTPHPHQLSAVRRMVGEPSALLAHEVGAGKTAEMTMGVMELRRLGLAKKPAIVIPNHMLEQFSREFLDLYPNAKILAASSDDLTGDKRRRFVAKAATGDWDAVIITQQAFKKISVSRETQQAYLQKQLDQLREQISQQEQRGDRKNTTLKELQKALVRQEEKLKKLMDQPRDEANVTFEESGIDYLVVDEAHHYKNLAVTSNNRALTVPGSAIATDLDMKLGYLRGRTENGRVLTFATATPIANAMSESYTMQKFLRPDLLEAAGIGDFDTWASTFGEVVTEMEVSATGGYKPKARFKKFRNVPEMLRMFRMPTDVRTAEDLNLPTPKVANGGRPIDVVIPKTDAFDEWQAERLAQLAEDDSPAAMLKYISDARKAALDLRMVGRGGYTGKIEAAADRIAQVYEANKDQEFYIDRKNPSLGMQPEKGALQIVFADFGTPGGDPGAWNAYDALRDELVSRGLPREKVRFIHEAKNDEQKAEMFAAARSGKIAVLFGSTQKMGVGTNVQDRAVALHHIDSQWRPADIHQREGRLVRQGNQHRDLGKEVSIYRYLTEGSVDAYMWQTGKTKSDFISQVMRGSLNTREVEDLGEVSASFAVAAALASGNPELLEKAKVDDEAKRLERLDKKFRRDQGLLTGRVDAAKAQKAQAERNAVILGNALGQRQDISGEKFHMSVGAAKFGKRADAGEALRVALGAALAERYYGTEGRTSTIGSLGGFDVTATPFTHSGGGRKVRVGLAGVPLSSFELGAEDLAEGNKLGTLTRLENRLNEMEKNKAGLERAAETYGRDLEAMQRKIGADNPYRDKLDRLQRRGRLLGEHIELVNREGQRSPEDQASLTRMESELTDLRAQDTDLSPTGHAPSDTPAPALTDDDGAQALVLDGEGDVVQDLSATGADTPGLPDGDPTDFDLPIHDANGDVVEDPNTPSEDPEAPDTPESTATAAPEVPSGSDAQIEALRQAAGTPDTTDTPDTPEEPQTPEAPATPDTTATPEVPTTTPRTVEDPRVTTDPHERAILQAAAARLDALPTDDEPADTPDTPDTPDAPSTPSGPEPVVVDGRHLGSVEQGPDGWRATDRAGSAAHLDPLPTREDAVGALTGEAQRMDEARIREAEDQYRAIQARQRDLSAQGHGGRAAAEESARRDENNRPLPEAVGGDGDTQRVNAATTLDAPSDTPEAPNTPETPATPDTAENPELAPGRLPTTLEAVGVTPTEPQVLPGEKFAPTRQQQDVIDAVQAQKNTLVQAKAGTGKTSTLEALARRIGVSEPDKRIAYIAFNKSVQVEAENRMPGNVEPRTGHSIAYQWASSATKDRTRDKNALRRPDEIARHLGITRDVQVPNAAPLSPPEQAMAALRAVDTWANSADDRIGLKHMPESIAKLPQSTQVTVLNHAEAAWADLTKDGGRLRLTLDHVRKQWALSRPDLTKTGSGLKRGAHILFLDEAQDTPPVLAKVVADQNMRKVIVGDADQAIYGFTGATDYLSTAEGDVELPLSRSWRFGPEVADVGNRFLQMLGSRGRVEGAGAPSTVHRDGTPMEGADAILVRSNGGMIGEILREQEAGRLVGVPKGTKADLQSLVNSARYLKGVGPAPARMHDDLAPFRTWDELAKEAEKGDDPKLAMLQRIVDQNGVDRLDQLVSQVVETGGGDDYGLPGVTFTQMDHGLVAGGNTFAAKETLKAAGFRWREIPGGGRDAKGQPKKAWTAEGTPAQQQAALARLQENAGGKPDVVVSTAHKAKGLEWDRVRIGDDFRGPQRNEETGAVESMPEPEELRLAYVAVTRAQKELDPGSLSYAYELTDDNGGDPEDHWAPPGQTSLPEAPEAPETPSTPEAPSAPEGPHTYTPQEQAANLQGLRDYIAGGGRTEEQPTPEAPETPDTPVASDPSTWRVGRAADGRRWVLQDENGNQVSDRTWGSQAGAIGALRRERVAHAAAHPDTPDTPSTPEAGDPVVQARQDAEHERWMRQAVARNTAREADRTPEAPETPEAPAAPDTGDWTYREDTPGTFTVHDPQGRQAASYTASDSAPRDYVERTARSHADRMNRRKAAVEAQGGEQVRVDDLAPGDTVRHGRRTRTVTAIEDTAHPNGDPAHAVTFDDNENRLPTVHDRSTYFERVARGATPRQTHRERDQADQAQRAARAAEDTPERAAQREARAQAQLDKLREAMQRSGYDPETGQRITPDTTSTPDTPGTPDVPDDSRVLADVARDVAEQLAADADPADVPEAFTDHKHAAAHLAARFDTDATTRGKISRFLTADNPTPHLISQIAAGMDEEHAAEWQRVHPIVLAARRGEESSGYVGKFDGAHLANALRRYDAQDPSLPLFAVGQRTTVNAMIHNPAGDGIAYVQITGRIERTHPNGVGSQSSVFVRDENPNGPAPMGATGGYGDPELHYGIVDSDARLNLLPDPETGESPVPDDVASIDAPAAPALPEPPPTVTHTTAGQAKVGDRILVDGEPATISGKRTEGRYHVVSYRPDSDPDTEWDMTAEPGEELALVQGGGDPLPVSAAELPPEMAALNPPTEVAAPTVRADRLVPGDRVRTADGERTVSEVNDAGADAVSVTTTEPDSDTPFTTVVGRDAVLDRTDGDSLPTPDPHGPDDGAAPAGLTAAQRRTLAGLNLDYHPEADVASAAARIRLGQHITPDEGRALAGQLRELADAPDTRKPQARAMRRIADRLDPAETPAPAPMDAPEQGTIADVVPGDQVAFTDLHGDTVAGQLTATRSTSSGRLHEATVEHPDGTTSSHVLNSATPTHRLPDLPEPEPVPVAAPPAVQPRPEEIPATDLAVGDHLDTGRVTAIRDALAGDGGEPVARLVTTADDSGHTETNLLDVDESVTRTARAAEDVAPAIEAAQSSREDDARVREAAGQLSTRYDRWIGQALRGTRGGTADDMLGRLQDLDTGVDDNIRRQAADLLRAVRGGDVADGDPDIERLAGMLADERGRVLAGFMGSLANIHPMPGESDEDAAARVHEQWSASPPAELRRDAHAMARSLVAGFTDAAARPGTPLPATARPGAVQGSLKDRVAAFRAALPENLDHLGKVATRRAGYGELDADALERGEVPAPVEVADAVVDTAADGGPGEHAMAHLDTVMGAGRELGDELRARIAADPRMAELDTLDERIAAQSRELDGVSGRLQALDGEAKDRVAAREGYDNWGQFDADWQALREHPEFAAGGQKLIDAVESWRGSDRTMRGLTNRRDVLVGSIRADRKKAAQADKIRATVRRDHALAVLGQVRGMGGQQLSYREGVGPVGSGAAGRAMTDRHKLVVGMRYAEAHLPKEWLAALHAAPGGEYKLRESDRGAHWRGSKEIELAPGQELVDGAGAYGANALHELSHGLEAAVPGLAAMERAYLWSRTSSGGVGGRNREQRRALGDRYHGDEHAYFDQFPDPYTGKAYDGPVGTDAETHELLSTAMESLFGGSDHADDGMTDWLLGSMAMLGNRELPRHHERVQAERTAAAQARGLDREARQEEADAADRAQREAEATGPVGEWLSGNDVDGLDDPEVGGYPAHGGADYTDKQVKDAYHDFITEQLAQAEADTNGWLLNKKGTAKGIEPLSLFWGPVDDVYRYASEELLNWFEDHPRMQLSQFAHQMTGQDRWAKAARRQHDANSRITRDRDPNRRPRRSTLRRGR